MQSTRIPLRRISVKGGVKVDHWGGVEGTSNEDEDAADFGEMGLWRVCC